MEALYIDMNGYSYILHHGEVIDLSTYRVIGNSGKYILPTIYSMSQDIGHNI